MAIETVGKTKKAIGIDGLPSNLMADKELAKKVFNHAKQMLTTGFIPNYLLRARVKC